MTLDFTIVTSFCKKHIESSSISQDIYINKLNILFKIPVCLVVFTEKEFVELFKSKRKEYGFSDITLIIERNFEHFINNYKNSFTLSDFSMLSDSSILSCFKFELMLDTINFNPFNTSNFSWLDAFICEKYSQDKLLNIFNNITDKFHIQIPNVINKSFKLIENKKDYYSSYKNVVCGDRSHGINISVLFVHFVISLFVCFIYAFKSVPWNSELLIVDNDHVKSCGRIALVHVPVFPVAFFSIHCILSQRPLSNNDRGTVGPPSLY